MNWIKQLMVNRMVSVVATADHVELSGSHVVMGLKISWYNSSNDSIFINDVQLKVYLDGRNESRRFNPLERFARIPAQRAFQKTPIAPFMLRPKETHAEQIRFLNREILDIAPGNYTVEVEIKDISDTSYICRTKLLVTNTIKYRQSEDWQED